MKANYLYRTVMWQCIIALIACGPSQAKRNPKKGLSMNVAQSCSAFKPQTTSSWWFSWDVLSDGFYNSFCSGDSSLPGSQARAAGMDFVPMFWGGIPAGFDKNKVIVSNLRKARYFLTYNEPDNPTQANKLPSVAAQEWPQFMAIAANYSLKVVAPCVSQDATWWYDQWQGNCSSLYNKPCSFDYICIHMYYQPYPCKPGVYDWACIGGADAGAATWRVNDWYNRYQKPLWVTEIACAPWGGAPCSEADHQAVMKQLVSYLDQSPSVYRYAWFTEYGFGLDWSGAGLNKLIWEEFGWGSGCSQRKWVTGWAGGITISQCVARADVTAGCYKPLTLSMDGDGCYCALDACTVLQQTWGAMRNYREVGVRNTSKLTYTGKLYERMPLS